MELSQEEFFSKYRIKEEDFTAANISWEDLLEIHQAYTKRLEELENCADSMMNRFRHCTGVHSVRARVKDSEHLIEKIIRKRAETPNRDINLKNYHTELTDLVGVRALHIFKKQWSDIHKFIEEKYELKEKPTANIREGDPDNLAKLYEESGCEVRTKEAGYRSVHYIVKTRPEKTDIYTEVQVRTLFEEGWCEIDHIVRYPYFQDNELVNQFLLIFNRLAGSADEMASFVELLVSNLDESQQKLLEFKEQTKEELEKAYSRITKLIEQGVQTKEEKEALQEEIQKIKTEQPTTALTYEFLWNSIQLPEIHRVYTPPTIGLTPFDEWTSMPKSPTCLTHQAKKSSSLQKTQPLQTPPKKISMGGESVQNKQENKTKKE